MSGTGSVVVQTDDELIDAVKQGQGVLALVLSVGPVKAELDASVHSLHGDADDTPSLPAAAADVV